MILFLLCFDPFIILCCLCSGPGLCWLGAVEALIRCVVGDLTHPLISQALALDNTEEDEEMKSPTQPPTTATGIGIAPLLTDIEIEMWWSSLIALGHLLTDCLPAKVIVDTSIGLKVFVQLLLPLTRSLSHHGNGSVVRKSGRVVEQGVTGATNTSTTTTTANTTTTTNSSNSNSNSNSSSSITQSYNNLSLETVPSRPTIISTLLLGTTTTTYTITIYLYSHNYNIYNLPIIHHVSLPLHASYS